MVVLRILAGVGFCFGAWFFWQTIPRGTTHLGSARIGIPAAIALANTFCLAVLFWQKDALAEKRKRRAAERALAEKNREVAEAASRLCKIR